MKTVQADVAGSVESSSARQKARTAKAFTSKKDATRYWVLLLLFLGLGLFATYGLLVYNNPVPIDSPSFLPVVQRRFDAIVAMLIAAICHSLATVAFQSITSNRIITPSLLGFESLYAVINTSTIFFLGAGALINFTGIGSFLFQICVMIGMSLILYGWLLSGKYGNLQLMLLVGIIIGAGLNSVSTFMRRLLAPSEFDLLQARLFGSVNNADPSYYPIAIPIVLVVGCLLVLYAKRLNVLALGKDVATSLGVRPQAGMIYTLILIAILMSISTALIGPLTFFGFLVATLSYQATPTFDHRFIFPMAFAIGFVIITGAYFLMYHVFHAQGVVSVIIELIGGGIFLIVLLRKRAL